MYLVAYNTAMTFIVVSAMSVCYF